MASKDLGSINYTMQLFVACLPGLEALVEAEVRGLGYMPRREGGGVEVEGELIDVMRLNLEVRTATRVLIRVATFAAATTGTFKEALTKVDWGRYFPPGKRGVDVKVSTPGGGMISATVAKKQAMDVLASREGTLRLRWGVGDSWTASVETSGLPLSDRGYHTTTKVKAPTKATVAAAMVLLNGGGSPVMLDPFCGGGTVVIEAAMIRAGLPPGGRRTFAFEAFPAFEDDVWTALRDENRRRHPPAVTSPLAFGSDRDAGAIEAARSNAETAGVADLVEFRRASFSTAIAEEPLAASIVTNPPWDHRLSSGKHDIRNLFAGLGAKLRRHRPDAPLTLLLGGPRGRISSSKLVAQLGVRGLRPLAHIALGTIPATIFSTISTTPSILS